MIVLLSKREFWWALLLLLPTLIVAGLYENAKPFAVTIHMRDPEQCGGNAVPSDHQTVRRGEDLIIHITLGDCGSWKGRVHNSQGALRYETTEVQSGRLQLQRIAEDQQVTILFHKAGRTEDQPSEPDDS